MAQSFTYKVKDKQANIISGTLDGESQSAVAEKLRQMGYTVISISQKGDSMLKEDVFQRFNLFQSVKAKDLTVFSRQFATMINAGLPLTRCLAILGEQTENAHLAKITQEVQKEVEAGQALSTVLAKYPKVFSNLFIAMIKAGEAGGVLDQVLNRIADHLQSESELKSRIKSAMAYPVVMFGITIIITFVMITFIVPVFENMFNDLGGELPIMTRFLLILSQIIRGPLGLVVLAVLIGMVFGFRAFKKT